MTGPRRTSVQLPPGSCYATRKRLGMTQAELARALGVATLTWQRAEITDRINGELKERLAQMEDGKWPT